MKLEHPNKKVALVTFSSGVHLWGDCCQGCPTLYTNNLNDYDWLIERGREYATALELGGLEDTYSTMESKIQYIRTEGATALGPALAISAGIIASTPMSEVILCTDGEPNVGIGRLSSQGVSFYSKIGEFAKENNTRLSVLAVEGQNTGLQHVQQCAVISGGTINVLNPLEMMRQLRSIAQNYTVATAVDVTVILHPELVFNEVPYKQKNNRLVKEVGNASRDTDLTFRYKFKNPDKKCAKESIPLQVQISYTLKNGMRCLRVLSKSREVTHDREQMERGMNVAVVGVAAVQRSARMASKGNAQVAQEHLKTTKRMMRRGVNTSTQQEELLSYTAESEELRNELRFDLRSDNMFHRPDQRCNVLSNASRAPSTAFFGISSRVKQGRIQQHLTAQSSTSEQYYEYRD